MSIYSTRESKNKKHGPSGAPGPAGASPGLANGETSEIVNIFVAVAGEIFWRKNIFSKKVSQCRKLKEGPFGIFKHPICCKISKKLKGGPIGENFFKSPNAKKLKGGPFGVFEHPFCRKTSKI